MTANLVDLLAISLSWWIVSLSGVLAPGPISAMAVTEGARRGAVAGPLIVAGHAIAELGVVVALALGLDQALKQPQVLGAIGLLGGIVLCWMGIGIVKTARAGAVDPRHPAAGPTPSSRGGGSLVRAGLLASVGIPTGYFGGPPSGPHTSSRLAGLAWRPWCCCFWSAIWRSTWGGCRFSPSRLGPGVGACRVGSIASSLAPAASSSS